MVVPSDVYPLIHALLTTAGLNKTASKLMKETKLQPKAFKNEHDLLDVYEFYLIHNIKKAKVSAADVHNAARKGQKKQSKSSSSSSSSSSDLQKTETLTRRKATCSSSKDVKAPKKTKSKNTVASKHASSRSDDTVEGEKKKSIKNAAVKKEKFCSSSDSSDLSESSDGEEKKTSKNAVYSIKKKVKAVVGALSHSGDSSSSSDSSDEVKPECNKRKTNKAPAGEKDIKKAKCESDSSSGDSSSSDDDDDSDSSDSDSDSDTLGREEAQKKEAIRREQAAKAALEWQPKKIDKVVTKSKLSGTPFQRVDGELWSQKILDDTLRDNSYEGTFGIDGVGVKANNKLLKTRGKDFTKGKNKLKRSTYMCGAISMASNSFKFED